MSYACPVCSIHDDTAWLRCNHPGCPDGRDQARYRPLFCDRGNGLTRQCRTFPDCDCTQPCSAEPKVRVPLWLFSPLSGLVALLGFLALLRAI